jgi:DNA-binding YbaB/EbfC family protein
MFDKMKSLWEMQKKMQEVKRELDSTTFEMTSPDGVLKLVMNGSQEVQEVSLKEEIKDLDKRALEKTLKDVYNKAIKRSHDIAAQKMKDVAGFNLPGLT